MKEAFLLRPAGRHAWRGQAPASLQRVCRLRCRDPWPETETYRLRRPHPLQSTRCRWGRASSPCECRNENIRGSGAWLRVARARFGPCQFGRQCCRVHSRNSRYPRIWRETLSRIDRRLCARLPKSVFPKGPRVFSNRRIARVLAVRVYLSVSRPGDQCDINVSSLVLTSYHAPVNALFLAHHERI